MHSRYEQNGVIWVDLESPSRDEVQDIVDEFKVDSVVAEELLLPSTKPHSEFRAGYVYMVLHFPALRHSHRSREQEIDFIVGKDFIVTVHYDTVDPLHKFSKVFEVHSILDKHIGTHAGFILFSLLKKLYKSVEHEVEFVRHGLAVIEENIFTGHEVDMVEAISNSARDLLNLRQVIEPHREVLREFETGGVTLFGEDFAPYLRATSNEYYRVHNHIMRATESLHELRETNNSLLTTKQNQTMKTFTVLAFFTLPLSFLAALFGMNTDETPFVSNPHGFWIVIGMMAIVSLCMFIYFRYKKWL